MIHNFSEVKYDLFNTSCLIRLKKVLVEVSTFGKESGEVT